MFKSPKENKCFKQYLCGLVLKSTTEIVCSDCPVKKQNTETHICVINSKGGTPSIEEEKQNKENQTIATTMPKEKTQLEVISTIISTTIPKGIEDITKAITTSISYTIQTTITTIPSNIQKINSETPVILLGCNYF